MSDKTYGPASNALMQFMKPADRYSHMDTLAPGVKQWPTYPNERPWFVPDEVEASPSLDSAWTRIMEFVGPRRPDIAGNIDRGRFGQGPGGDLQSYMMEAYRGDQSKEMIDAIAAMAEHAAMPPPWHRVPRRFRGM